MHLLTRVSLANRVVVALVTLLVMGLGVFAASTLKQELFPSLELPTAAVIAPYPGAAPDVVEREVTEPLEAALRPIGGVSRVQSTTTRGVSQLTVQWDYGQDSSAIQSDIEQAVSGLRGRLPDAVEPQVLGGSLDAIPIVALSVTSDDDEATLARKLRDIAAPRLVGLDGVRAATVSGDRAEQIVITFRPDDVTRHGVTPAMLPQVLQAAGATIPAGDVEAGGARIDVQVGQPLGSVADVRALRLQGSDGPVRLEQVAHVRSELASATTISRTNGQPSLGLAVTKDSEGNTVSVARAVQAQLPGLAADMGNGAQFSTVFDQAPFIERSIEDLGVEGALGLAFAVFVIFAFLLSVRPTLIAAISIPTSLLVALIALWWGNLSLNIFTLGALTVAIGRVVDDSIVVIENIKRHAGLGERGPEAIIGAVREVAGAITASTIATVVVFLPLGLVSGEVGELFRPFALTTSIALVASLFVSLTIVPVLASWFMVPRAGAAAGAGAKAGDDHDHEAVTGLQRPYIPALLWSLQHKVITSVLAVVIFLGTMALVPLLKTDFLGDTGQDTLTVAQDLPPGTTLEVTDEAAQRVEQVLAADPAVATVQSTVGGGEERAAFGGSGGASTASMVVGLHTGENATIVSQRLRDEIAGLRDVGDVRVSAGGGPANSDVSIKVQGSETENLATAADRLVTMMRGIEGLEEVHSDLAATTPLLQVDVDPEKAAAAGMTQAEVGQAVTAAVRGTPAGQIVAGDTRQDILMRSQEPAETVAQLEAIELPITAKQTMDARTEAGERVADRQQAMQERQQAEAMAQAGQQLQQLRAARVQAARQAAQTEAQLRSVRETVQRVAQGAAELQAAAEQARGQAQAQLDAQARQSPQ
ncbi:putative efflux protein, partial [Kineosphaera limosa NBRC 100340]